MYGEDGDDIDGLELGQCRGGDDIWVFDRGAVGNKAVLTATGGPVN